MFTGPETQVHSVLSFPSLPLHPIPQVKQPEEEINNDMNRNRIPEQKPNTKPHTKANYDTKESCHVQTSDALKGRVVVVARRLGGVELLGYALREEGLWLGPGDAG